MKNDLNGLLTWALQFNKTAKIKNGYIITDNNCFDCSNADLIELPNNIDKLVVHTFICSYNRITKLPNNIDKLKVDIFNCSHNKINKLPDSIGNMKVNIFYCQHNKITELPDSIGNMKVNHFSCHDNLLTTLPDSIINMKVNSVVCSYNKITKLPDSIGNIKVDHFACQHNQITELPDSIGDMKVNHFNCFSNHITKLPDSIINMKVKHFNCHTNLLEVDHIRPNKLIEGIFDKEGYCFLDGLLRHIINIKIKDNVKIIKTLNSYIVSDGINHAHGKDIKTAYLDYKFKISTKDLEQYKSININELHNLDYLYQVYRNITGSCQLGMADWISNNNDFIVKTEKSGSSIKELLEITKNDFGNGKLIEFFNL